MARSKWKRWLALASTLVGSIAIGTALFPHQRLLLDRASKVANVRDLGSPESPSQDYQWVSDTVLFTGAGERGRLVTPLLYDIRSRKKTPLSRLRELLKRDSDTAPNDWELSPDGKWILWTMGYCDVRVARLDGSGFQIVPLPTPSNIVGKIGWQDDKGHWMAEGFDYASGNKLKLNNMFEGDANKPGQQHSLPLSEDKRFFDGMGPQVDEKANSVVVGGGDKKSSTTLYPPNKAKIVEVVKSTRGDRIAWVLLSTNTPPLARWIRSVFPRYAAPHTYASIWVCGINGTEMHEVGRVMLEGDVEEAEEPNSLWWLPSDSRLSFLYKDSLWTVPVE